MDSLLFGLAALVLAVAVVAGVSLLLAWPFMWIWNYAVVSAVTIANPVSYWVAFWLMVFFSSWIAGSKSSSGKDK